MPVVKKEDFEGFVVGYKWAGSDGESQVYHLHCAEDSDVDVLVDIAIPFTDGTGFHLAGDFRFVTFQEVVNDQDHVWFCDACHKTLLYDNPRIGEDAKPTTREYEGSDDFRLICRKVAGDKKAAKALVKLREEREQLHREIATALEASESSN